MSKLSFLKLDIEIMNDSKIKILRKMPGGGDYFVLWVGLLCLAMKSGRPGCVEVGDGIPFTPEMLAAELDLPVTTVQMGLDLFHKLKMIESFEDETIFLINFEKHQELTRIEEKRAKERERKRIYREKAKRLSLPCPVGQDEDGTNCPAVDKDKDKDTDKDKGKRKTFTPPTPEQVREYCQERKNTVDPEVFCDFYIAKGWMVGKNKMKDWKAAVRTWERKEKKNGSQPQQPSMFRQPTALEDL